MYEKRNEMKKIIWIILLALGLFAFDKSVSQPHILQQGPAKMWCSVCGMNLAKFYKTNHAVVLKDGTKKEYCSMHCFVEDWPRIKDEVSKILVVDAKSGKWIDAKNAWYVVGSDVKGTMSGVSKLAFASKADALGFAKIHGGKVVPFDQAFEIAQKSLDKERKMIHAKQHKMERMGQMIYKKRCKPIQKDFSSIAEAKGYITSQHLCPGIKGKRLQAVAIYLTKKGRKRIVPPKDAKCPVCGMFVAKYPRWTTMIVEDGKKVYFDGVKDMMRYIHSGHKFERAYVSDYYTGEAVDATKAWYVTGSDVLGPMGKELVPFKTKKEAMEFAKDHKGQKVLSFSQIDESVLKSLE